MKVLKENLGEFLSSCGVKKVFLNRIENMKP